MTHVSGSVYTLWSILSVTLFGFLISHLWKFDRFDCLRWGRGKQAGAFKRVMTFTYLMALPLIIVYSIGMMTIKYREGYAEIPGFGVIPNPYPLWSPSDQNLLMKCYMVFATAWGLEIVTHLEELCFWLFLVNVGPSHSSWFGSLHFKIWAVGSVIGLAGMPITTWYTRSNPTMCEAYTFLAGSSASLLITLGGLRVLWVFPRFLVTVKSAGGEPEVVIRLTTFHDLNILRVLFRFMFCVPLFILAIDGVHGHHHDINESALWTDLLASLAGLGMVTSSALTLLIFFPRSIEREAGYKPRRKSSGQGGQEEISLQPIEPSNNAHAQSTYHTQTQTEINPFAAAGVPNSQYGGNGLNDSTYGQKSRPFGDEGDFDYPSDAISPPVYRDNNSRVVRSNSNAKRAEMWEMVTTPAEIPLASLNSNDPYRAGTSANPNPSGVTFDSRIHLTGPSRPARHDIHPILMNYSSPINFNEAAPAQRRRMHRPQNAV